jgi:F-type H+-transporting ATPase subunit b
MKFNIWTFLFQVINFLVLLFILKRVLYRPVKEIMEKRRRLVEKEMQDAENTRREASELRKHYEEKIASFREAQVREREKMQEEIADERRQLLARAKDEAETLIEKERVLFDAEKKRVEKALKEKTVAIACEASMNVLRHISDEELHRATYRKFLGNLGIIATGMKRVAAEGNPPGIEIATAYELTDEDLSVLRRTLEHLAETEITLKVTTDRTLLAGVKVKISDMVYDATLSGQIGMMRERLREVS